MSGRSAMAQREGGSLSHPYAGMIRIRFYGLCFSALKA